MKRPFHTFAIEGLQQESFSAVLIGLTLTLLLAVLLLWSETGPAAILGLSPGMSIPLVGIALGSLALVLMNEKRWVILSLLALSIFVFRKSEDGFTAVDLAFGLFVNFGLVIWFVKEVLVLRRPLIRSRFELYLLTTLLLCLFTSTVAEVVHGMNFRYGSLELIAFTLFFFYFPFRNVMKSDRDVLHLFITLLLFGLINGAMNVLNYQERVIQSALTFGAVNARSTLNEPLTALLFCGFFMLVAGARTFRMRIVGIAGVSLFAGLLVLSLSRGPIAAALAGSITALLLLYPSRTPRMMLTALVALGVNIGAVFVLLPDFASSIFENITERLETVERLSGDQSFNSRFAEYQALYSDYIPKSPVIGYGFGVQYDFYDRMFDVTYHPYFTHNGYLHALFKFGIPAGLMLLSLFFVPIFRFPFASVRQWPRNRKLMYGGALSGMITMMVINITSNSITYYTEIMLIALLLALFDYLYTKSGEGQRTIDDGSAPRELTT